MTGKPQPNPKGPYRSPLLFMLFLSGAACLASNPAVAEGPCGGDSLTAPSEGERIVRDTQKLLKKQFPEVVIPKIGSPLDSVSCQLLMSSESLGQGGECSGTFIRPTVFLAAGHCFGELGLLGALATVSRTQSDVELTVNCPGGRNYSVKKVVLHDRWSEAALEWKSGSKRKINPSSILERAGSFDFAALETEPVGGATSFPRVVQSQEELEALTKASKCAYLGYSSYTCNVRTGKGCYREDQVQLSARNNADDPDPNTGGSWVSVQNPNSFKPGDSGSGLVCQAPNGERVLIGIMTRAWAGAELNAQGNATTLLNVKPWLDRLLNTGPDSMENVGAQIDPKFAEYLSGTLALQARLRHVKVSVETQEGKPLSRYSEAAKQLSRILLDAKYDKLIAERKVLDSVRLTDNDGPHVVWEDHPRFGKVLEISRNATTEEIESALLNLVKRNESYEADLLRAELRKEGLSPSEIEAFILKILGKTKQ